MSPHHAAPTHDRRSAACPKPTRTPYYQALSDVTDPAARLDRADANGTSAAGGFAFFGRWDDTHLMYEQRGLLPRGSLGRLCELLVGDPVDDCAVKALSEPLEDGVER
ncbi:hypothetical protein GCM10010201_26120 [Pilimelia columellifera subsp. columellifera]|uniref:Uncharacterized protein n=1 Tax=Pilimelia columellifera subsp. columellifera TaxID=706583 RepID=A0ABN3NLJ3_9ACTN